MIKMGYNYNSKLWKEMCKFSKNHCEREWSCFSGSTYVENPCKKCQGELNKLEAKKNK